MSWLPWDRGSRKTTPGRNFQRSRRPSRTAPPVEPAPEPAARAFPPANNGASRVGPVGPKNGVTAPAPNELRRSGNRHSPASTSRRDSGMLVARRLRDIVVAEGLITPEQFADTVAEKRPGESLSNALLRRDVVTEDQLVDFFSRHYRIPIVTIPELPIPEEIIKVVPAAVARKHEVIPVWRTPSSLTLAIADATNVTALDDVAFLTGLQIIPAIATPSAIRRAVDQSYEPVDLAEMFGELERVSEEQLEVVRVVEHTRPDVTDLKASADQEPVVRLVDMILTDAVRRRVSDVHLEADETAFHVRFRIDGMLREVMSPPRRLEQSVISRLKIMANLDIAERRLPQDGRIRLRHTGREVDFRVSILPTVFGESVALRMLDNAAYTLPWPDLGFDPWSQEHFEQAIRRPHGMILITGPTGSGKTTTLYSAIHRLNSPEVNIVTVEDPVEYKLRGLNQVQVNDDIGLTFAAVLRSFLRHDPNVVLVGEMRDTETAQIAVRASLTGHLVMSTLHTNDCPSTVARLIDMGIPPFLVASSLRMVLAQRLVRRVCAECREPYEPDKETLTRYGHGPENSERATFYRGKGCPSCNFTGLRGRVALYETMPVSPEIRALIMEGRYGDIQEEAQRQGMKTLREVGFIKVVNGITTIEEVLRVTED
jgi:type IV pilus assembly protein PilB